jgi:hypothetical protein
MSKSSNEETIHNEKYCSDANPSEWCNKICDHGQPSKLCQKYIDNKKKQQENHSANSREQTDNGNGTEQHADNGNISNPPPPCNAGNAECQERKKNIEITKRQTDTLAHAKSDLEIHKKFLEEFDKTQEERRKAEEEKRKAE